MPPNRTHVPPIWSRPEGGCTLSLQRTSGWAVRGVLAAAAFLNAGCETISDDEYAARLAMSSDSEDTDGGSEDTDDCPNGPSVWYTDADADGYGDPTGATTACAQPPGTAANFDDCDDTDPEVAIPSVWYLDADLDGYGSDTDTTACRAPSGYIATTGDCVDTDDSISPAATEVCDAVDNDCDGLVDDLDPDVDLADATEFYRDADTDGVGTTDDVRAACAVPDGYAELAGDCDDTDASVSPGATEVCNDGIDNDCDGTPNDCALPGTIDLASQADVALSSPLSFVSHGERVAPTADLSGDGLGDLLVSVPEEEQGVVYVVDDLPGLSGDVETADVALARITGPGADSRLGHWVADLGDIDGDGLSDIVLGDPYDDTMGEDAGAAWVLAGPLSGAVDVGTAGVLLTGASVGGRAGWVVEGAGDVNADGALDVFVGAYTESTPASLAGAAYLVHGPLTANQSLADAAWVVRGGWQDRAGFSVAAGSDLNGDGLADLVVGADRSDAGATNAGAVLVYFGPVTGEAVAADADASRTMPTVSAYVGAAVEVGGDPNGDGYNDLLVGATGENGGGTDGAGAAFLVSGPLSGATDLSAATARLDGQAVGDLVGSAFAFVPDMSADGRAEVVFGARGSDQGSGARDGAAYLFLGPVSGTLLPSGADSELRGTAGMQAGASLAAAPDLNADGLGDLLVGAPTTNQAFVVFGGGL